MILHNRSMHVRLSLVVSLLALSAGLPARANMVDQIIRSKCLDAVNAEIKSSGKPAPAGMSDYTCDCVVQEFKKGNSISQASGTCKQRAVTKYGV
ncbi:hypothetical protein [Cyanobium sp. CH-040]|uniref:hypothetical protein n=1 Tax=Cyanobium sp. CH-040 TaxID=2823708 RepID=UPI0020CDB2A0|nr:hypothetical protein [Cyanobium sp. CH-040]MCP9928902.1 hypothetical protein [Cyanobium sp. CH-040]